MFWLIFPPIVDWSVVPYKGNEALAPCSVSKTLRTSWVVSVSPETNVKSLFVPICKSLVCSPKYVGGLPCCGGNWGCPGVLIVVSQRSDMFSPYELQTVSIASKNV